MDASQPPQPAQRPSSPWSFRIATVAGIPIRIHFTFLLFLAWIALLGRSRGDFSGIWLVPAVFFCVLLHELGHALVAKRYGIQTLDITFYPIGGVAMFQSRMKPAQELWITLAGPMVNVVLAIIFGVVLALTRGSLPPVSLMLGNGGFVADLFVANVVLAIFNMIPAFPMDGGRVLRAILALHMPETRATQIAGAIGQLLAIVLGFAGLMLGSILLMLVAFFVFLGAGHEVAATMGMSLISGHTVADAMITEFVTLQSGQSVNAAADLLLAGSQHDFPIVVGEEVIGLLTRSDLIRGLSTDGPGAYVSGHMRRDFLRAAPSDPLENVVEMISQEERSPVLVFDGAKLVGMVTAENLSEFLMVEQARGQMRRRPA